MCLIPTQVRLYRIISFYEKIMNFAENGDLAKNGDNAYSSVWSRLYTYYTFLETTRVQFHHLACYDAVQCTVLKRGPFL